MHLLLFHFINDRMVLLIKENGDYMTNIKIQRKSLDEIQLARAFAIIAVLLVHSTSQGVTLLPPDSILYPIYNFFNIAGKLGTPTFIFLSSFVLFYNYYSRETTFSFMKSFYVKRMKFILVPYLLFSGIYFVYKWYKYYDYPSIKVAVSEFIRLVSLGQAHAHLYFVFISVQFYILFPLLLILFKKSSFVRRNSIWLGVLIQWIWVILNKYYFGLAMKPSIALSYFSFYFMGAYLGIYYDEIKEKMNNFSFKVKVLGPVFTGFVVMLIIYTGVMYFDRKGLWYEFAVTHLPKIVTSFIGEFMWAFYSLFAALVIFYVAHKANDAFGPKMKTLFMELGNTSFGIYLIHMLYLLFAIEIYSSGTPLLYHGWQFATFILITVLSWATVRLVYYFVPFNWVIFGKMGPIRRYDKEEYGERKLKMDA